MANEKIKRLREEFKEMVIANDVDGARTVLAKISREREQAEKELVEAHAQLKTAQLNYDSAREQCDKESKELSKDQVRQFEKTIGEYEEKVDQLGHAVRATDPEKTVGKAAIRKFDDKIACITVYPLVNSDQAKKGLTEYNCSLLYIAVGHHNVDMVNLLLQNGADIDDELWMQGKGVAGLVVSPLEFAIFLNDETMIQCLLDKGAQLKFPLFARICDEALGGIVLAKFLIKRLQFASVCLLLKDAIMHNRVDVIGILLEHVSGFTEVQSYYRNLDESVAKDDMYVRAFYVLRNAGYSEDSIWPQNMPVASSIKFLEFAVAMQDPQIVGLLYRRVQEKYTLAPTVRVDLSFLEQVCNENVKWAKYLMQHLTFGLDSVGQLLQQAYIAKNTQVIRILSEHMSNLVDGINYRQVCSKFTEDNDITYVGALYLMLKVDGGLSDAVKEAAGENRDKLLKCAIQLQDLALVTELFRNFKDQLLVATNNGADILLYAAHYGNAAIIDFLIQQGIDADATNDKGETVLYRACKYGCKENAEFLLARSRVEDIYEMLCYASTQTETKGASFEKIMQMVLCNIKESQKKELFICAITARNEKIVSRLTTFNQTAAGKLLCDECKKDNADLSTVQFLVECGAPVNYPSESNGSFYWACAKSRFDIAQYLVPHISADTWNELIFLLEPAQAAKVLRKVDFTEFYRQKRADNLMMDCYIPRRLKHLFSQVEDYYVSVLVWYQAMCAGNQSIVTAAFSCIKDDTQVANVFVQLIREGRLDICTLLFDKVNEACLYQTLLHARGQEKIVNWVLSKAKDNNRLFGILWSAVEKQDADMVDLLFEKFDQQRDLTDNDRNTVLHKACEQNDLEAVRFLLDHRAGLSLQNNAGKQPAELTKSKAIKKFFDARMRAAQVRRLGFFDRLLVGKARVDELAFANGGGETPQARAAENAKL